MSRSGSLGVVQAEVAESGLASWPWLPVWCAPPVAVRWRGDGGCGLHRGLSNFGVFSLSCNSKLLLSVSVLFISFLNL